MDRSKRGLSTVAYSHQFGFCRCQQCDKNSRIGRQDFHICMVSVSISVITKNDKCLLRMDVDRWRVFTKNLGLIDCPCMKKEATTMLNNGTNPIPPFQSKKKPSDPHLAYFELIVQHSILYRIQFSFNKKSRRIA